MEKCGGGNCPANFFKVYRSLDFDFVSGFLGEWGVVVGWIFLGLQDKEEILFLWGSDKRGRPELNIILSRLLAESFG